MAKFTGRCSGFEAAFSFFATPHASKNVRPLASKRQHGAFSDGVSMTWGLRRSSVGRPGSREAAALPGRRALKRTGSGPDGRTARPRSITAAQTGRLSERRAGRPQGTPPRPAAAPTPAPPVHAQLRRSRDSRDPGTPPRGVRGPRPGVWSASARHLGRGRSAAMHHVVGARSLAPGVPLITRPGQRAMAGVPCWPPAGRSVEAAVALPLAGPPAHAPFSRIETPLQRRT